MEMKPQLFNEDLPLRVRFAEGFLERTEGFAEL